MFLKHPMSGGEIPKGLQLLVQLCYKLWEGKNEEV